MPNRIVYNDYAVGALEHAVVDAQNTDQQLKDGSDVYGLDSIFSNTTENKSVAFDKYGIPVNSEQIRLWNQTDAGLGFVSSWVSDTSCSFLKNGVYPKLTINIEDNGTPYNVTGNGITLHFTGGWCSVSVAYYNGSQLITEDDYEVSEEQAYLQKTVNVYNKIVITFKRSQYPKQYARVWKMQFGKEYVFDKFKSISIDKKIDWLGADIPIGQMDATFVYDEPLNILKKQRVMLYHNDVLIGTYGVSGFERQALKMYTITADDVFGTLENIKFNGIVELDDGVSLEVINGIRTDSSITIYSTGHTDNVRGYIGTSNCRKALANETFASARIAKANADGSIKVFKIDTDTEKEIDGTMILGDAVLSVDESVTSLIVNETRYLDNIHNDGGTNYACYTGTLYTTGVTAKTNFPIFSFVIKDETGTNIPLFDYHSEEINADTSTVFSDTTDIEDCTIYAVSYVPRSTVKEYTKEKGSEYEDVTKEYSGYGAYNISDDWFEELKAKVFGTKGTIKAKVILNDIDVGDYVSIETKYDGIQKGVVTQISADVGAVDIVGNVVIQQWQV